MSPITGQLTQKLSGGQTQRVRFALAVIPDPELLVLDEPTVGMDVEARHAFWTTMRDFAARGRTVLSRPTISRRPTPLARRAYRRDTARV
jgi:ABC-2 type transport system ATP-binding protein